MRVLILRSTFFDLVVADSTAGQPFITSNGTFTPEADDFGTRACSRSTAFPVPSAFLHSHTSVPSSHVRSSASFYRDDSIPSRSTIPPFTTPSFELQKARSQLKRETPTRCYYELPVYVYLRPFHPQGHEDQHLFSSCEIPCAPHFNFHL
jgi:hypothetical protein